MSKKSYGAEEARTKLPELLERAHRGQATVITKHGKPYAALVPAAKTLALKPRLKLLALAGSGKGLWGRGSAKAVDRMRDEW
jgi:prevent-host-death family protein